MPRIREGRMKTDVDTKEAYREMALAHLDRLYATARRLVADEAEDLVQEALMKGYASFSTLEDRDAGGAWLVRILVNCCRDRGRARARQPVQVDIDDVDDFSLYKHLVREDPFPYSDSLHLDFLQLFGKEDVDEVLLMLPVMYRVPLVLVHMDGYSTKEVAKILDVPLGTVLARLHRGRKLFEKTMWEYARTRGLLKEGIR